MSLQKNKLLLISIFILSCFALVAPLFFKDELRNLSSYGLVGIFFINLVSSASIFLPAPGILSVVVGAQIYDPMSVAIVSSVGATLGETVSFMLGHSSKHIFKHKKKSILFFLSKFTFKKWGVLIIFLTSLIPNPLIDGVGILAGVSSYSLKKFMFLVFLGKLLRNIVIVYIY